MTPAKPQPPRNVTIFDVARAAGVSKSTVSNVVRGVDRVSDDTRLRVLDVIEQLHYKPNGIARQFVKRQTTMIGVLVGDLGNAYHAHLAQVVERALFRHGHTTMFCNIEGDEELAMAGVNALLEQRVAGFVFLALIERTPQLAESLRARRHPHRRDRPAAGVDGLGGTERPRGRPPRDAAPARPGTSADRVRPHRDRSRPAVTAPATRATSTPCARRASSRRPRCGGRRGRTRSASGGARRRSPEALRGPKAPTAVFVWNDFGAIGLIDACEEAGIDVPGDLSVVGFDDIAMACLRRISLTTISQPLDFQAEKAVAMLLDRINGRAPAKAQHLRVPVELRVRGSSAPPRV